MNLQQLAGVLIMVGFVLFVVAMFVAPRLYQEPDIDIRLEIIADNQSRWIFSQIFFALGGVVPAIGFLLLTIHLYDSQNPWLINLGAAAFLLGAIFAASFVYLQTLNPAKYWESAQQPWALVAYIWLTLVALILYGIVFLQGTFPNWLGYMTIGSSVILLIAFLVVGTPIFWLAFFSYVVTLVIGIVALRQ